VIEFVNGLEQIMLKTVAYAIVHAKVTNLPFIIALFLVWLGVVMALLATYKWETFRLHFLARPW